MRRLPPSLRFARNDGKSWRMMRKLLRAPNTCRSRGGRDAKRRRWGAKSHPARRATLAVKGRDFPRVLLSLLFALALLSSHAHAASDPPVAPLGLPPIPATIAGTSAMRALGEKLFFDRSLSINGTLSCAMCHIPAQGFASNQSALSIGMEGRTLKRNAPTLYNVVYKQLLFHDGRETDLAAQVWGPLLNADEMGNPGIGPLVARLQNDSAYGQMFTAAFPGEGATMMTIGRALAAYEATLLRGDSRFDRAVFGAEMNAMTKEEWRGFTLFREKGCASCHVIGADSALFTDQAAHNTGVGFAPRPATTRVELAPGVFTEVRLGEMGLAPNMPHDVGRFDITRNPADRWAYVTPMLRGARETAPYMHDGSLATLAEVVDFYDRGGGANPALDARIRPLGLSAQEKAALIAFLNLL